MTLLVLLLVILVIVVSVSSSEYSNDDALYDQGNWRSSIVGTCWTDPTCTRKMTTVHGGEWNVTNPYDSFPAFEQAYIDGGDSIKGDFRVSADNIGMVMHSSPILFYESPNCYNKKVEEMTSAECQQCKMEITDYTFITAPYLLDWAKDKINVMFCVKESRDIARAISTLIENNATHRAWLEVGLDDLLNTAASNISNYLDVYYVVELRSSNDVDRALAASPELVSRMFLMEFNDESEWPGDLSADIAKVNAAGLKAFAATNSNMVTATVDNHLALMYAGFDVVYTYNLQNAVEARVQVNTEIGITPP